MKVLKGKYHVESNEAQERPIKKRKLKLSAVMEGPQASGDTMRTISQCVGSWLRYLMVLRATRRILQYEKDTVQQRAHKGV